jgi:hypothetical protein
MLQRSSICADPSRVALPGPDLPCAGSTEPSMGMKVHIKRGIPNLLGSPSRPLFPEGDVSI